MIFIGTVKQITNTINKFSKLKINENKKIINKITIKITKSISRER